MVAIEFILVVLGVLLAFQINEWANRRAAAAERRTSTERLLEEAELTVAYNRQAVDFERGLLQDLTFAVERLAARNWQKLDEDRITAGLARARTMVALAPPSSVYDDVVSSGRLNEIGTVGVRAAISRYRGTLSFEARMVSGWRFLWLATNGHQLFDTKSRLIRKSASDSRSISQHHDGRKERGQIAVRADHRRGPESGARRRRAARRKRQSHHCPAGGRSGQGEERR